MAGRALPRSFLTLYILKLTVSGVAVIPTNIKSAADVAHFVREQIPAGGLFAGLDWRISPEPFSLGEQLAKEIDSLGRVLLQFYRAVNLLYRRSAEGRQPAWVAELLDRGKPPELIELQRSPGFKNDVPRVIRPDILLTETGFSITELDSVPGGIGLTAWLNQVYSEIGRDDVSPSQSSASSPVRSRTATRYPSRKIIGGADGMIRGFECIFGDAKQVHIVVSEEAATYRPEMEWMAGQFGGSKCQVQSPTFNNYADGDAVYRFFELFDLANVPNAKRIFELAVEKRIRLTPPPKPLFEEKMLFALLWNRNLRDFWRQELGEAFFNRLKGAVPYTWLVDPAPLPPHAAIPELNLTDWRQLKLLSQRERDLILKVSGFSEHAWGARGVYLGSDLSQADWAAAVDRAMASFSTSPFVLQRYEKPKTIETQWFDFGKNTVVPMKGRVRLCPYYFVEGEDDAARAQMGGILATVVPADKKIVHGMSDAILTPCTV
jgi:hypothetical protein